MNNNKTSKQPCSPSLNNVHIQDPTPKYSDPSLFDQTADFVQGLGGIHTHQEGIPNGTKESCTGFVAFSRPAEPCRRACETSQTPPPSQQAKTPISRQYRAVESNRELLDGHAQAHTQTEDAEIVLSMSGVVTLGAEENLRPLAVLKSYWADIAPEEKAEWYQPFIFHREAA